MLFKDISAPLIERGIPVVRLYPREKRPVDYDWPSLATTDLKRIRELDGDFNCGAVAQARPGGVWFFEIDKPELRDEIERDCKERIPKTFMVRSSPGRGHFYWRQSARSLAMGNIGQQTVEGQSWSARVDNEFVVGPGSLHPKTGNPYEIVCTADIIEAPVWLIDWCLSKKGGASKAPAIVTSSDPLEDTTPILEGARDNTLASIAGKLRQKGFGVTSIRLILGQVNESRVQPPMSDEDLDRIAGSIARYPVKDTTVLVGGVPAGSTASSPQVLQQMALQDKKEVEDDPEVEPLHIEATPYPKFPQWVMYGTSIYEGFVKPYCSVNSRIPEFMFMPAVVTMMNYLGTKVTIERKDVISSLYLALIGRAGDSCKSSSVRAAFDYFNLIEVCDQANSNMTNASGKSLIWTAGSMEGLGVGMQKTNCKNAILYYDELSKMVSKAGIDASSFTSELLNIYESSKFANQLKGAKATFSISPGTYCASLITCTTDKMFQTNWSKLAGGSTGLDDRFYFLLQPEKLPERKAMESIQCFEGAHKTRELIDRAIQQKKFKIMDESPLSKQMNPEKTPKEELVNNREEMRVYKFALYFCIDLGYDEIDDVCLERALALVKYEKQVKRFYRTFEAVTKEGALQQSIRAYLIKHGGNSTIRKIESAMHPLNYGTGLWDQAVNGLIRAGIIVKYGKGSKSSPLGYQLLKVEDEDED